MGQGFLKISHEWPFQHHWLDLWKPSPEGFNRLPHPLVAAQDVGGPSFRRRAHGRRRPSRRRRHHRKNFKAAARGWGNRSSNLVFEGSSHCRTIHLLKLISYQDPASFLPARAILVFGHLYFSLFLSSEDEYIIEFSPEPTSARFN